MNKAQAKRPKQRYFPKNYAPARAAALKSKKKSVQLAAKASIATEKATNATKRAARKLSQNLSSKSSRRAYSPRKPSASTPYSRRKSSKFSWREATLASMIGASAIMIAVTLVLSNLFDPVKRSEQELEKLADAYYIEYLYPRSLGKYLNEPETVLKDYVSQGLPTVLLRQLLLYNDGKNSGSIEAFSNNYYQCDTNKTYVRFYPVEPYGPRDYTVQYGTACEKVGNL